MTKKTVNKSIIIFAVTLLLKFTSIDLICFVHADDNIKTISLNQDQEKLAQEIFSITKCMVCQGESIKESNTDFAQGMREVITDKIAEGEKKDAILSYIRERYGEEAILEPQFTYYNITLWLLPLAILGVSLVGVIYYFLFKESK